MNKVKLFVDSTCDLPLELVKKYALDILPLYITMGDKTVKDDDNIGCQDLFDYVENTKNLPKTAAVNMVDFIDAFKPWLDKGYDICFTGISAELSSTFQNAFVAMQEIGLKDRIYLIDSRSLSSGVALVAIKMAEFRDAGLSAADIKLKLEDVVIPKVNASFFVPQLDYLYKGGRCTLLSAIVASTLKICPQLQLKGGKIVPNEKYRGSWKKVCSDYMKATFFEGRKYQKDNVFITHTALDKKVQREQLAEKLKTEYGFENVYDCIAGATIASHCGPDTLGVLFLNE
jgi:DegV family protein with EDD domain